MPATLGTAILELAANTARFTNDLGKGLAAAERFKKSVENTLAGVGAGLGVKYFADMIKGSIDAADKLNDLKTRTGESGESLLVLQGAAKRGGVDLEAVGDVASKLAKRLAGAADGTGEAANSFQAMGIKVEDANGHLKNVGTILREVGDKFKGYEDGAGKAALATGALGKGGDRLIPMLETIGEVDANFKRLGITISDDVLKAADKFNDTLDDIKSISGVVTTKLAAGLLPTLQNLAEIWIENQKDAQGLANTAGFLSGVLKTLATGAVIVKEVFKQVGLGLAGVAAAVVLAAKGEFRAALAVIDANMEDTKKGFSDAGDTISKIWDDATKGAQKTDEAIKKVKPPKITNLQEQKAATTALEALLKERTKLAVEAVKDEASKRVALLDRAHAENLIGDKSYFRDRLSAQKDAYDLEAKALDQQIAHQTDVRNKAKPNTKEYYEAQKNLEETLAKRNGLEREFGQVTKMSYLDAQLAARQYHDSVENINIQILELQGNLTEATKRRLALSNRDLREKFTVNNDPEALKQLDTLEKLQIAQAGFNQQKEKLDLITGNLQVKEDLIQNSLRVGAISEIEALSRTSTARQDAVGLMQQQYDLLRKMADDSGNPKLILEADQMAVKIRQLSAESHLLADKFNGIAESAFATELNNWVDGTKTFTQSIKDMGSTFVKEVNKMVAADLAKKVFGGFAGGDGGGGIGGFMAKMFSSGAASGGGSGAFAGASASAEGGGGWISALGSLFGGMMAGGGRVDPSKAYVVGENEPELFVPDSAGKIIPSSDMNGGGTVINHFYLSQPTDRRSQAQIAGAAQQGIDRSRRIR